MSLDAAGAGGRPRPAAHLADPEASRLEEAWAAEWERQVLNWAMDRVRHAYQDNKTFRAFELYAILGHPAEAVADQVGLSVDGVYQAKRRVTEAVREGPTTRNGGA